MPDWFVNGSASVAVLLQVRRNSHRGVPQRFRSRACANNWRGSNPIAAASHTEHNSLSTLNRLASHALHLIGILVHAILLLFFFPVRMPVKRSTTGVEQSDAENCRYRTVPSRACAQKDVTDETGEDGIGLIHH